MDFTHLTIVLAVMAIQPQTIEKQDTSPDPSIFLQNWLQKQSGTKSSTRRHDHMEQMLKRGETIYVDGGYQSIIHTFGSQVMDPGSYIHNVAAFSDNMLYYLAGALIERGSYQWAKNILLKLLSRKPRSLFRLPALSKFTQLILMSGHHEYLNDMKNVLQNNSDLNEKNALLYLEGKILADVGSLQEAEKILISVPRSDRFYAAAQYVLGVIALERNQLDTALGRFCSVVDNQADITWADTEHARMIFFLSEKSPEIIDNAWLALGRLRHKKGWYAASIEAYRHIEPHSPLYEAARYESAWSLARLGENKAAGRILNWFLEKNEPRYDWPEATLLLGRVLLAECRFDEAAGVFAGLIDDLDRAPGSRQAKTAVAPSLQESQVSDIDRLNTQIVHQVLQTHQMLIHQQSESKTVAMTHHLVNLINSVYANLRTAEVLTSMLADQALSTFQTRPESVPIRQLGIETEKLTGKIQASLSSLLHGLGSVSNNDLQADMHGDALAAYLNAERHNLMQYYKKIDRLQEAAKKTRKAAGEIRNENISKKISGWIRAARIGEIDAMLAKKQAVEVEIQNLALGLYPYSALKDLAESGMLIETMEYWPYEGEQWPDEIH